jgi:tetratricopeptide (TPR) repeat protein
VQGNGTASKLIFIFNVELRSMKKLFCLLLFALSFVSLHAQYDPEKVNKKAVPYFTKAQQQLDEGHIKEAIASLNQALQIESGFLDAYLVLAAVYSNDKNYIDCIKTYEKASPSTPPILSNTNFLIQLLLPVMANSIRRSMLSTVCWLRGS